MRQLKIGGIYNHFKNHRVKVLGEAYDSETNEKMTIYIHLQDGTMWVRPTNMFLDTVSRNGSTFERFQEIELA
jgi:hypothetical protein